MSTFINVTAVGHLGGDATMKMTPDGRSVVEFSLAINQRKGDQVTWYRCSLWGPTGPKLLDYLTKGTLVAVIGNPAPARAYTRQDGSIAASNDIFVNNVQLLSSGQKPTENGTDAASEQDPTKADAPVEFADSDAVPV